MSKYSAQGSITVKRLRNGDTIYLTLELNGIPLFQAVDSQTGIVSPNWGVAANQPIITPHVGTTRGNSVTLANHSWQYNGNALQFTGATSGGFTADSTGKFAMNQTTGALKIIANLASASNMANDTLLYSCTATIGGVAYTLTKSIDVQIQSAGASSYFGFITASTTQLDSAHDSTTLKAELWLATAPVTNYYVKWYKGSVEWSAMAGQKSVTVNRNDIDATQLFVVEYYQNQGDTNYVARAAISIIDTLDEIIVVPYISSANKEVDTNKPVTVAARIVKAADGSVLTPSNPAYKFEIYDGDTWQKLASATSSSINVETSHTDKQDGTTHDVEVLVTVEFDSLN